MKAVFISDTHIKKRGTRGYDKLMAFLDSLSGGEKCDCLRAGNGTGGNGKERKQIDDLYILGDFFDFWFCEGAIVYPDFNDVIEKLRELKTRGVRIHICEGNHDFFLTEYFADQLGFEVIKDWASIDLDGIRVLISHGDTVDEGNIRYLILRRLLRSSFFYKLQRILPIVFRWKAAQISSDLSKELTVETADALAEKMRRFSQRKFRDGFEAVVLGHCHKCLLEEQIMNGGKKTFAILGDWGRHSSYLYYDNSSFALLRFTPSAERAN